MCLSPQHATLQLIKAAVGQNGVVSPDDMPVSQVLSQVCPSSWRGACKTAVQLLFGQAGLVSFKARHLRRHTVIMRAVTQSGVRDEPCGETLVFSLAPRQNWQVFTHP